MPILKVWDGSTFVEIPDGGAHPIASHSDTMATGAELETLTDGSNADTLHSHAAGGGDVSWGDQSDNYIVRGDGADVEVSIVKIDDNGYMYGPTVWPFLANDGVCLLLWDNGGVDFVALRNGTGIARIIASGDSGNVNLQLEAKGTGVITADNDGTDREVVTISGTQVLSAKTLTTPTIGDFSNATHNHEDAPGGDTLDAAAIAAGTLAGARLAAKHKTHTLPIQVPSPADGEEYVVVFVSNGRPITIIQVIAECSAGTVDFNFQHRAQLASGTPTADVLWAGDKTISAVAGTKNYPSDGAFDDATVDHEKCLAIVFASPVSIGTVRILLAYTVND